MTTDQPPHISATIDPVEELYARPGFLIRRAHQIAVALFMDEAGSSSSVTTT